PAVSRLRRYRDRRRRHWEAHAPPEQVHAARRRNRFPCSSDTNQERDALHRGLAEAAATPTPRHGLFALAVQSVRRNDRDCWWWRRAAREQEQIWDLTQSPVRKDASPSENPASDCPAASGNPAPAGKERRRRHCRLAWPQPGLFPAEKGWR